MTEARLEITEPSDAVGVIMAVDVKTVAADDDPDKVTADEVGPAGNNATSDGSPKDDVVSEEETAAGKVV